MTRGARQLRPRLALPSLAVGIGLAVTACGGGGHKDKTTTSPPVTSSTTPHQPAAAGAVVALSEAVRDQTSAKFTAAAKVRRGESVFFRTGVPATGGSGTRPVRLSIASGPSRSLTVAATWNRHTARARILSADGHAITLVRVHYACLLPPAPSFCPARHPTMTKVGYRLQFPARRTAPVLVQAVVGPVKASSTVVRHATPSVVPAYTPTQLVQAITPPAAGASTGTPGKSSGPRSTVAVKPRDTVVMITHLAGRLVGATQATTVTIEQGPARSVAVSAKVAGAASSTATVTSASGSPITLVLPHYVCFAPPQATFCPPRRVQVASHRYRLTFLASPFTPPLVFIATAGAG